MIEEAGNVLYFENRMRLIVSLSVIKYMVN